MKKSAVAAGVAAALASLSAYAQDAAPAPAAAASAPRPSAADSETQKIVVTAQKRKEDILEVPLAVSVISADALQAKQITSVEDLTRNVPNVSFTSQGGPGLGTVEIRGVSSQAGSATVSVYIDDVSLTTRNLYSQGTAEPHLFDLSSVEVLRGPQGTLYGASSLGGTIKYMSNLPNLRKFEATGNVDLSKTDGADGFNWQTEAVVSIPLVKNSVAVRLGVQSGHQAGYIDQLDYRTLATIAKGINSSDWNVFKGSLKADLGGSWSVTPALFAQQENTDDIDASYYHVGYDQVTPHAGETLPRFTTTKQVREPGHDRLMVPSVTVDGDVGIGNFTGVVSGYKRRFNRVQDGTSINSVYIGQGSPYVSAADPGSPVTLPNQPAYGDPTEPAWVHAFRDQVAALPSAVDLNNLIDQTSAELRLTSKDYDPKGSNPFTWIGGFYIAKAKTQVYDNEPIFGITKLFTDNGFDINDPTVMSGTWQGAFTGDSSYYSARHYDDKQHSLFGEVTLHATPAVSATVGLRWLSASQHFTREGNYYYSGCGDACPLSVVVDTKGTTTTPSFKFNWTLDPSTALYANITKGFRLGGANRPVPDTQIVRDNLAKYGLPSVVPAAVESDSLWNYELGSKQRLMNNKVNFNVSAYFINWKNMQQDVVLDDAGYDFETNTGKAHLYGLEAELRAIVSQNLTLGVSGSYEHAAFAVDVPGLGGVTDSTGTKLISYNVNKGDPVPGVPQGAFDLNADYHWDLNDESTAFVRGNAQWTGSSKGSIFASSADRDRPAYWTFDSSAGVSFDHWSVTLYVKNLLNNHTAYQHPSVQGVDEAFYLRPRTIGVNLSANF